MILADGVMGQAMEPVVPQYREPPRPADDVAAHRRERPGAARRALAPPARPRISRSTTSTCSRSTRRSNATRSASRPSDLDDAEIVIVAYGTAARVARTAVERGRARAACAAGIFRPITLWPFPSADALADAVRGKRAVVVVELSAGQMVEDVRLAIERRAAGLLPRPNGRHGAHAGRGARRGAPRLVAQRTITQGQRTMTTQAPDQPRLIYQHPASLVDRSTHYCPGCGHGIIHRLIAELSTSSTSRHARSASARSAAASSPTTTSTLISSSRRTAARRPWRPAYAACDQTRSCSPTRATATWRPSVPPRSSTPRHAARTSASSSSTTASTA